MSDRIRRPVTPAGAPQIGKTLELEALCEALDGLPDEAVEVVFVTHEQHTELFWRAEAGDWNLGQALQHALAGG